ncbi:AAC-rich mRNA clone AAC11 protein-like isoform X2 [Symsagittifera roscoffensis]|uniref:AAC-rich mRNA clone AAC11 protein-like isoform X2 n=1 Tax=Symsagittifera roscoffensis TaxID=84072 RepID=UPI00307B8F0F
MPISFTGPAVPAAELLQRKISTASNATWDFLSNDNLSNLSFSNINNVNNNNNNNNNSNTIQGVPVVAQRPGRRPRNFTLSLNKEGGVVENIAGSGDPFSPSTPSNLGGIKEKRRKFRKSLSTSNKNSPIILKSVTMSPNPTNYTQASDSPNPMTNQKPKITNGAPPAKPIRGVTINQNTGQKGNSLPLNGSNSVGTTTMTRNDLDLGFSETSLLATSRMDATVVTTADNNNPPCSVNRRQVNGVLKNSGGAGKGYAEVTCEDDSAECQKNATVKCKPAVNCFKLREFQRDNSSHMSSNEQSMFYTAMAELEQIQPRSRLANCELVFFGPDPEGFNPVFYAGSRRNKYLCVWQEDRQSALFISRGDQPTDFMSRPFVISYCLIVAFLLLLAYQYWLIKYVIEFTLDKFLAQPIRFEMMESSSLTLRAKILGPQK